MEWQRDRQTAPGECVVASPRRRVCASALARLEPTTAPTGVHAIASPPARGSASGAGSLSWPGSCACAPVPCTTRALSSRLSRAARAQRPSPNIESGCHLTLWLGHSLLPLPLFLLPCPHSTFSSAQLSFPTLGISSSTTSLRNSWEWQLARCLPYPGSIRRAFREKVKGVAGRGRSRLQTWPDVLIGTVIKH